MVSWKTARKVLRPAGISAAFESGPVDGVQIFEGKLVTATIYTLRFTKPIPTPSGFEACLESAPSEDDFEIISF